jgi:YidC/Oxa1 family membrane protein insertase
MRGVIAAFIKNDGKIDSLKIDNAKLRKFKKAGDTEEMQLRHKDAHFLWAAVTNKYFTAILRPVPEGNDNWPKDVRMGPAEYYDTELAAKKPGDDANNSFSVRTTDLTLAPAGTSEATKTLEFQLYLGPKDRDIFNDTPLYKRLSYFHAIDFRSCFCCPTALIRFLAFGIMAIMNWMYAAMGPAGNYGIVIMLLVFMMRLILHPVTKKSQVSMMKMQKLGPMTEELKKKYANNKAELQKQTMKLYRDQGVSPISSMLPMMIQMPIWISLWTAVSASVELRGASFLPFWITDLSAPDALFRFEVITIPIVGWEIDSFNLLPLLMGVVMFLQQKLMPHASSQQTNPQVAQQQKMMMIMMPLMFPIMLYKGASGVNLYILSSISAGVIEQIVIRKHIREKEAAESVGLVSVTKKTGGKVKKKKPKPFFKT